MCVCVPLPEKGMGQVDEWGTTTALSFFRFIDCCWTSINKRALLYHFLFLCQAPILSSPLSSFFILSAPLWFLISFRGAVAILLHLASLLGCLLWGPWWNGVRSLQQRIMEKTHYHIVSSPHHAALVCHFLSAHSNMCEWACACTRAGTHMCACIHVDVHSCGCCTLHLTHTDAGLYGFPKARKQGSAHWL